MNVKYEIVKKEQIKNKMIHFLAPGLESLTASNGKTICGEETQRESSRAGCVQGFEGDSLSHFSFMDLACIRKPQEGYLNAHLEGRERFLALGFLSINRWSGHLP